MKWLLFIVIIAATSIMGHALGRMYGIKRTFYSELCAFCERVKETMNYDRLPLYELLEIEAKHCSGELAALMTAYASYARIAGIPSPELMKGEWLSDEQKQEVKRFFDGLGASDGKGQILHASYYADRFKKRYEDADSDYKLRGSVPSKMGILSGILVCILLV